MAFKQDARVKSEIKTWQLSQASGQSARIKIFSATGDTYLIKSDFCINVHSRTEVQVKQCE